MRFQNWKLYGERGLAMVPVTVWVYDGSLKVEHQAVTVSQYSVAPLDSSYSQEKRFGVALLYHRLSGFFLLGNALKQAHF